MLDEYSNEAQTHCLLAVTVHFLDDNYQNKHYVLGVKTLKKSSESNDKTKKKKKCTSHSAENMAKLVKEILEEYGLLKNDKKDKEKKPKIFLILRDGASSVVKLCRLLDQDSVHCFAHRLQLSVKDALKEVNDFDDLLLKIKKLIRKLRKSYKLLEALQDAQELENLPQNVLQRGIDVRWSSLYQMLNSFVKNKQAIKRLAEENPGLPEFLNEDWAKAESVRDSLKIFCEATTETPLVFIKKKLKMQF
uniref:Transposase n=1 Tax=Panagrolaimus davidi TaxID=227884 RepID=A0A914QCL2_9BILA